MTPHPHRLGPDRDGFRRVRQRLGRPAPAPPPPRPPAPEECSCCGQPLALTRHHLVPRAAGGTDRHGVVRLCAPCHRAAHDTWGEGHRYIGPTDRAPFLVALRAVVLGRAQRAP